jgi:hypothetical protein
MNVRVLLLQKKLTKNKLNKFNNCVLSRYSCTRNVFIVSHLNLIRRVSEAFHTIKLWNYLITDNVLTLS